MENMLADDVNPRVATEYPEYTWLWLGGRAMLFTWYKMLKARVKARVKASKITR